MSSGGAFEATERATATAVDDDGGDGDAAIIARAGSSTASFTSAGGGAAGSSAAVAMRRDAGEGEDATWEEIEELSRALRRVARGTAETAEKMAGHALATHCLRPLVVCAREEAVRTCSRVKCTKALQACEATLGTFTQHRGALEMSLKDDEQMVIEVYVAILRIATSAMEREDVQDFETRGRWGDIARSVVSKAYAERWSVKVIDQLRMGDGSDMTKQSINDFVASEEVALVHALSEGKSTSLDSTSSSRPTTRTLFDGDRLRDDSMAKLERATLKECSKILKRTLRRASQKISELSKLLAQICLDVLTPETDTRLVERVVSEIERACGMVGTTLASQTDLAFLNTLVFFFVKSYAWETVSSETLCALSNALYSVAISSGENLLRLDESFALLSNDEVSNCILTLLCSHDLDLRDAVVKFLEAAISNDDVNIENYGCVPKLLKAVLEHFSDAFILDERLSNNARTNKITLDSAPMTLIRLALGCPTDGAKTAAKCLLSTLARAKLAQDEDQMSHFIPAIRIVSFILHKVDEPVRRDTAESTMSNALSRLLESPTTEELPETIDAEANREREINIINLQDEFGRLFTIPPENLTDDDPSEDVLNTRLARLDAVLDAAAASLTGGGRTGEERVRNTLPELWGRIIAADAEHLSFRERLVSSDGDSEREEATTSSDRRGSLDMSSGLCTFITSGESFQEQHWYFCYDCNLVASRGCCSNCAKTCHVGHRIVYSRKSRFFCDCGADGAMQSPRHKCFCLDEQDFEKIHSRPAEIAISDKALEIDPDSDSEAENDVDELHEPNLARRLCSVNALESLRMALKNGNVVEALEAVLISWFKPLHDDEPMSLDLKMTDRELTTINATETSAMRVARNFKAGSFELRALEAKPHVQALMLSGIIVRNVVACSNGGHLAIGEGDKISILDANIVIGAQATSSDRESSAVKLGDKVGIRPLSRNVFCFDVVNIKFNHSNVDTFSVVGLYEVQICTLNKSGDITDRLRLADTSGEYEFDLIIDSAWVPNSMCLFALTGRNTSVLYDLSRSATQPACTIIASPLYITSSVWVDAKRRNYARNITLTNDGSVYALDVPSNKSNEFIHLNAHAKLELNEDLSDIYALAYSEAYDVLFVNTADGGMTLARVATSDGGEFKLSSLLKIRTNDIGHLTFADFCLPNKCGPSARLQLASKKVFIRQSSDSESVSLISVDGEHVESIPLATAPANVIGFAGYQKAGSGDFPSALITLREDGSMQISAYDEVRSSPTPSSLFEDSKKQGGSASVVTFDYNFFEKLAKVTPTVDFGGSFNRGALPSALRSILQSEDGFIEAQNSDDVHLTVQLSNGDSRVIRGVRIHIGGMTMTSYAPSKMILPSGRVVKFERESRRWYDIPFTCSESATLKDSVLPMKLQFVVDSANQVRIRIDRLEVYASTLMDLDKDVEIEFEREAQSVHDALNSSSSRSRQHLMRDVGDATVPSAWLQGTISIIRSLRYCDLDLKSSKLRVVYEAMLRKPQFNVLETQYHRSALFLAWAVLSASAHDADALSAINIKDNSTLLIGHKVAENICSRIIQQPLSVKHEDLVEYHFAIRKLGRLAIRRPRALLDSSPYLKQLCESLPAMLDAGSGSWNADEVVPYAVHAITAVLRHERDAQLVRCMFHLITCEREDVQMVAAETLLSHLIVPIGNQGINLNQARRNISAKPEFRREKYSSSNGIRDLVCVIMQVNDRVMYKSQALLIRALIEVYPECLNPELCRLPPLRGNIIEYDALTWRLAISAECLQLHGAPKKDAREALLHAYALACELLRRSTSHDLGKQLEQSERGYGALLECGKSGSNRSSSEIASFSLESTIIHATSYLQALELDALPEREKSDWLHVLSQASALRSPSEISKSATTMITLLNVDMDAEVLNKAGVLLNLVPSLRKITDARFSSPWCADEVAYADLLELKSAIQTTSDISRASVASLRYFMENIDFEAAFVIGLTHATMQLPSSLGANACHIISCIIQACKMQSNENGTEVSGAILIREIVERLDLVVTCALQSRDDDVRRAATGVLSSIWESYPSYRNDLLDALMECMQDVQSKGHRAKEVLDFMQRAIVNDDVVSKFKHKINHFCIGMKDALLQVSDHVRTDLYRELEQRRVFSTEDVDKYWLETDCGMRDAQSFLAAHEFEDQHLDTLKKQQMFTKNSAMTKFRELMTVDSITVRVTEVKTYLRVKEIEIWRMTADKDANTMRTFNSQHWQLLGKLYLSASDTEKTLKLDIPVDVWALNLVFKSFHENVQAKSLMTLHCPRCARHVTDVKHGICSNCRENAYQCRYCRNINYEKLDAFICNECGHCRYAKIQTTLHTHRALCERYPKLHNSNELSSAIQELKHQADAVKVAVEAIESTEASLRKALFEKGETMMDVGHLYKVTSKNRRMELIAANFKRRAIHNAILHYLSQRNSSIKSHAQVSWNFGTCCDHLHCVIKLCTSLSLTKSGVEALSRNKIHEYIYSRMLNSQMLGSSMCNVARTVLANMAARDESVRQFLCKAAFERANNDLSHFKAWSGPMVSQNNQDMLLLRDLIHANAHRGNADGAVTTYGDERSALMALACKALSSPQLISNPVIADNVILPALEVIHEALTNRSEHNELILTAHTLITADAFQHLGRSFSQYLSENRVDEPTLVDLMPWFVSALFCASKYVRLEVIQIISLLTRQGECVNIKVAKYLLHAVPKDLAHGACMDYLNTLNSALRGESVLIELNHSNKLVNILISMLRTELDACSKYIKSEAALFDANSIDVGFGLQCVSSLLNDVLKGSPQLMTSFMDSGIDVLVRATLCSRALKVCQAPSAMLASETFDALLQLCVESSEDMKAKVAKICVALARSYEVDSGTRVPIHVILDELAVLVLPHAPPQKVHLLRLLKSATQEEFIPGTMARNPYSSSQLDSKEPLMRDVKNLICRELDMVGLVDDDFGMELLVANQIISLDLAVADVFERVWMPSLFDGVQRRQSQTSGANEPIGPPMAITFRLSGLDGEATEERIDRLAPSQEEDEDLEAKYAATGIFQQDFGFKTLIQLLPNIRAHSSTLYTGAEDDSVILLRILRAASQLKKNRQSMLMSGALASLLDEAALAFKQNSTSGNELLLVIEMLLQEEQEVNEKDDFTAASRTASGGLLAQTFDEDASSIQRVTSPRLKKSGSSLQTIALSMQAQEMNHVEIFSSQLKQLIRSQERHEADILARIIPRLAGSVVESKNILAKNFDSSVRKLVSFDDMQDGDAEKGALQLELECSTRLADAIPRDLSGQRVLEAIWSAGTVTYLSDYVVNVAFGAPSARERGSPAWDAAIERSGLPLALELLNGVARGYKIDVDANAILFVLLHKLESVTERDIGSLAENCLETLATASEEVADHLDELRAATRDENRRKALAKREQMLAEMGMKVVASPSSPGAPLTIGLAHSPRSLQGYESMMTENDKDSIVCRVCFEGYALKPRELLGVYCYNKLALTLAANGDASQTVCTVSHFNAIHFSCHASAKRADVALRTPKREWEGAALRNSETLCNNLLPVSSSTISESTYAAAVDAWWQNAFAIGALIVPTTRARQSIWDVALLLGRFAMDTSFSTDCRGGGKQSNMHLLPQLVRLAVHQVALAPEKGLEEFHALLDRLCSPEETWHDDDASGHVLPAALVLTVITWTSEKWSAARRNALISILRHAKTHGCARISSYPSDNDPILVTSGNIFAMVRPLLIYFGLINKLHEWFKPRRRPERGTAVSIASDARVALSESNDATERARLIDRLGDIAGMLAGAEDALEWLQDARDAEDAQELLDACDVLPDALNASTATCDAFFARALDD